MYSTIIFDLFQYHCHSLKNQSHHTKSEDSLAQKIMKTELMLLGNGLNELNRERRKLWSFGFKRKIDGQFTSQRGVAIYHI